MESEGLSPLSILPHAWRISDVRNLDLPFLRRSTQSVNGDVPPYTIDLPAHLVATEISSLGDAGTLQRLYQKYRHCDVESRMLTGGRRRIGRLAHQWAGDRMLELEESSEDQPRRRKRIN